MARGWRLRIPARLAGRSGARAATAVWGRGVVVGLDCAHFGAGHALTHGRNLDAIVAVGELRAHATAGTVADIADAGIKTRRTTIEIGCGPGGFVGDYVPFYFAPRSPMPRRGRSGH